MQDEGYDTIDANLKLGFEEDQRDYYPAAHMLKDLQVSSVRLLTNNPDKVFQLERYGIQVDKRVSLKMKPNKYDVFYLQVKKERMGHYL